MKNRALRLALAAGVAALAAGSSAPAAHATYCNPDPSFKLICGTITRVCQTSPTTASVCGLVE